MKKRKKKNLIKIGILGGTFDPAHKGHLYIAKTGIKKLKLKKLIWVVTKKNPLKKKPYLALNKRIKFSKKITNSDKKIIVQYLENKVGSNSTFNLLNYIKRRNKASKLYFLMGEDNLLNFHKWDKWKKIPKIAKIIIFPRKTNYNKSQIDVLEKLNKNDWAYINSKKINISSSLIRKFW